MKDALMHSDAAMFLNENVNSELVEFLNLSISQLLICLTKMKF